MASETRHPVGDTGSIYQARCPWVSERSPMIDGNHIENKLNQKTFYPGSGVLGRAMVSISHLGVDNHNFLLKRKPPCP